MYVTFPRHPHDRSRDYKRRQRGDNWRGGRDGVLLGIQLASSQFCGVFPGDGFSARMEDAVMHGCIPVIIQVPGRGGGGERLGMMGEIHGVKYMGIMYCKIG